MMRMRISVVFISTFTASAVWAGRAVDSFNELGYGTLSGRLQTVSMYRDYDHGNNAYATSLGLQLDYRSPEKSGFQLGVTYLGVGVLDAMDYDNPPPGLGPGENLLANGRNNLFNQLFLSYDMRDFGLTNTTVSAGRKVTKDEVFQLNEVRHKPRSVAAVQAFSQESEHIRFGGGHSWEMSNWISSGDRWKFNNYGEVFSYRDAAIDYDTAGVTWAEAVWTGVRDLELALYDAVGWDVANLLGIRAVYAVSDSTRLLGYFRTETDVGRNAGHDSNAFGLSAGQRVGSLNLEGGYFGVFGDNLLFEQTTTGINHALGASMMIYAKQYNGGAQTVYLKADSKIEPTDTSLYALYNFTWHDENKTGATQRRGHELNVVAKQPVPHIDGLSVALKFGLGALKGINGAMDDLGTDTRLFVTFLF